MATNLVILLLCVGLGMVCSAPAVKYDQRQEGDVNIRADLENFVILIIPTSGTANLGLLDILSKSIPGKNFLKHNKPDQKKFQQIPQETQHFIESKTAPYHVDISRTRSHLAKLHPQVQTQPTSEVLIAHSPTVTLKKDPQEKPLRTSRTLHINPQKNIQALVVSSDMFVGRKNSRDKKNGKDSRNKGELMLLGAELDQCAPDQKRDSNGICQLIKE